MITALSEHRFAVHRGSIFTAQHILHDKHDDIKYTEMCSKFMDFSVKNSIIRMIITSICVVAMTSGPSYALFIQHVKATGLDVRVPFTDERSSEEFIISISVQLCLGVYGIVGLLGMEIMMEIFVGFVMIAPKLIEYEIEKMNKKIAEKHFKKLHVRLIFRNIVQQIMDADEYVNSFSVT